MNKNKQSLFTKHFLILTILLSLLLNAVPGVRACGPYHTEVLFSYDVRPENLKQFASGDIGILRPSYARSYLIVAYRALNDLPLSKEQQKKVLELWNYRLGIDDSGNSENEGSISNALENWSKARYNFLGENDLPLSENDLWKRDATNFNSYVNCTKSGFETATKTLESRLEKHADETTSIKEWLNGQDTVFSNCSAIGKIPNKVGADSPQWLQQDRDYQIAAAQFYAGKFKEAKKQFERISKDTSSEWSKLSNYLVARTYLRMASLDKSSSEDFAGKAESHLLNLLKDERMQDIHKISRQLLYTVASRLKTKERFHKFSDNLSVDSGIADMRSEIGVYTKYLDHFGFKPEQKETKEEINPIIATQHKTGINSEPSYWVWIWNWIFGESASLETNASDTDKSKTVVIVSNVTNDYAYDKPTLNNSMRFSSDIDFKNIAEVALQDDISSWIFSLQSNDRGAFEHSLKKWKETSKIHWLVAAISSAESEYSESKKLLEQADEIKADSPGFPSVKYHQARLLIEQGKSEEARRTLDKFLKRDVDRLPVSTQNTFYAQRMLVSKNLDEFLKFAQRKAIAYTSYLSYLDETEEIGKYRLNTRDRGMLRWRNRSMFDHDSTEIFNKKMPLEMLMRAGLKKEVPAYLRKGILISALTRAILLENNPAKRKIARDLIPLAPEMEKELKAYSRTPNHLNTFKLLINYPVLQPLVDPGFARFVIPSNSLAYDRDNWWYREELEIKKQYIDEPLIPKFLSKSDLEIAEGERSKMVNKGHTGEILSAKAILAVRNFPKTAGLPKLLYKTLQANRYGDNEGDNRRFTKRVFQTLHKRYPESAWTKRSPVWY